MSTVRVTCRYINYNIGMGMGFWCLGHFVSFTHFLQVAFVLYADMLLSAKS